MRLFALSVVAGLLLPACAGAGETVVSDADAPAGSAATVTVEPPMLRFESPVGTGSVVSVRHRLLVDGSDTGETWTAGVLDAGAVWAIEPEAEIAENDEVWLSFTLSESSSCSIGPFVDLAFDEETRTLFPVVTPFWDGRPDEEQSLECNGDANPHTVVVAVARDALPAGDLTLWIDDREPPEFAERTQVAAGQLRAPDPSTLDIDELGVDDAVALPVGERRVLLRVSTHCGLRRLFEIDGTQWLLGDGVETTRGLPLDWVGFERGEEIDLVVERTGPHELTVAPLGSDLFVGYGRAADTEGCA